MDQSRDLYQRTFDFVERIRACDEPAEIERAIVDEMKWFGFECVTCWTLPAPGQSAEQGVILNTRPIQYLERYLEQNYVFRDPVVRHLRKELRPFSWGDVRRHDALTKAETKIIDEASEFGMTDGLVIPVVTISGSIALFSPCGNSPNLSPEARTAVELMGVMALQALKRATLDKFKTAPQYKPLSPREREVLQWVAAGKSDDEISQILNIGMTTVIKHVESAKAKLDTYKRSAAIITALRLGEIHL